MIGVQMQENNHNPQYPDSPSPNYRVIAYVLAVIILLTLTVGYYAATAESHPGSGPPVPPTSTRQADVIESRLLLVDGRVVLCLQFPSHAVACDWAHAISH